MGRNFIKFPRLLSALLLLLLCIFVSSKSASGATIHGQRLDDGTIEITKLSGEIDYLYIPSEIEGVPITSIGSFAFKDCDSLVNVHVPEGITNIADDAFYSCRNLKCIWLPDSITQIGSNPWRDCQSMEKIVISPDHASFEVIDDILYSKEDRKLIFCPLNKTNVIIKEGTKAIGDSSFLNNKKLRIYQ